ncbi:hypothetical protein M8A51_11945 [Schlegelella sp. S2-27]|uniref:ODP domain-containing protein n=1 Tax=Caldimonas mangrovi TaxID=2944811 RepID=A0ABT0YNC7_9BURK|nr:hypothetical protein [Caldimonas mangrovi]MCM5680243.1 hypothetical protein [Caldimonas mangrovi]
MVSNKVLRRWANRVRTLPIEMIVPQHGAPMKGKAVHEVIERVQALSCGIDLMTDANDNVPRAPLRQVP